MGYNWPKQTWTPDSYHDEKGFRRMWASKNPHHASLSDYVPPPEVLKLLPDIGSLWRIPERDSFGGRRDFRTMKRGDERGFQFEPGGIVMIVKSRVAGKDHPKREDWWFDLMILCAEKQKTLEIRIRARMWESCFETTTTTVT